MLVVIGEYFYFQIVESNCVHDMKSRENDVNSRNLVAMIAPI